MARKKNQTDEQNMTQRTNEEQMLDRQSAPRQTMQDFVAQNIPQMQMRDNSGAVNGFRALSQPIGAEAIHKATQTLQKYKEGKANLEKRIIDDEEWYKLRHWECMRDQGKEIQPTSAWLFNCIANKHADLMDNFPAPNILPREQGDEEQAKMLTSIVPVILDQNDFEGTYDECGQYKLIKGTGVYGVFWDSSKLNGLGDISIEKADILNLFWKPGITDIQKSPNLFQLQLMDNDALIGAYPQLQGKLGNSTIDIGKYVYDDKVDTTDMSVVIDWYYKKANSAGQTVLHYCKYVNDTVLFATENEEQWAERGFYDHGKYPFIFDPLFRTEGTPAGFSYIDVGKSSQEYIDRGNQAIMENMLSNTAPRFFVRNDGSVNEAEYADQSKPFVHTDGNLGTDSILPIQGKPLNDIYVQVITNKVDELKETTGNRDISTGGTTSGVTAASAIAAMQEAGSKLSRDSNKASYRAFKELVLMVIELIRQFYDMPRCFRIIGENGAQEFVTYSNELLKEQRQGIDFGMDMGTRIPLFDVEVVAQKQSPYSKMAQNELALQFYSAGFFNPQMADQALACLEMMDFDRKDPVMQRIAQNGTMYQMMMQMQQQMMALGQIVDASRGGNEVTASLAAQFGMQMPGFAAGGIPQNPTQGNEALGGEPKDEAENTKKARQRVADSTSPE